MLRFLCELCCRQSFMSFRKDRIEAWTKARDERERLLWLRLGFRCIKIIYRRHINEYKASLHMRKLMKMRMFGNWARNAREQRIERKEQEEQAKNAIKAALQAAAEMHEAEVESKRAQAEAEKLHEREQKKYESYWANERKKAEAATARARAIQVLAFMHAAVLVGGWLPRC